MGYGAHPGPVGAHRGEVAFGHLVCRGDKLMILPGAFQGLFTDKIEPKLSTGACKFCAVHNGVRMQLKRHPKGIAACEEMANPLCDSKIPFKEIVPRDFFFS